MNIASMWEEVKRNHWQDKMFLNSSLGAGQEHDTAQEGLNVLRSGYFSDQLRAFSQVVFDPEFPETMPEPAAGVLSRVAEVSKAIDLVLKQQRLPSRSRERSAGQPAVLENRLPRAPFPIQLSDIVIFTKESKVEYDMRKLNLSELQLREKYRDEGADEERIFASHFRQKEAEAALRKVLGPVRFVSRRAQESELAEAVAGAKLAVALGGDNHFQFVAQLIKDDTPILGVNSDPQTSFGALLSLDASGLIGFVEKLTKGDYRFEPWTRFETRLNGTPLAPALCDIFLGERARMYMSRHVLEFEGHSVEQKSSGLLFVTGAGSTSWYYSASRFLYPQGDSFSPCSRYAKFINTEPSSALVSLRGRPRELPEHTSGTLFEQGHAVVHSLNDSDGLLSLDSLSNHSFKRGSVVEVRLAAQPLWVVRPN